jgi:hypothetical protein
VAFDGDHHEALGGFFEFLGAAGGGEDDEASEGADVVLDGGLPVGGGVTGAESAEEFEDAFAAGVDVEGGEQLTGKLGGGFVADSFGELEEGGLEEAPGIAGGFVDTGLAFAAFLAGLGEAIDVGEGEIDAAEDVLGDVLAGAVGDGVFAQEDDG